MKPAHLLTLLLAVAPLACDSLAPDEINEATPTHAELNVTPIAQQTEVWCWAASAQMILNYYNEPNLNPVGDYQCGVVGVYWYLVAGPYHACVSNCYLCQTGASSTFEVQRILTGYGSVARSYGFNARVLSSKNIAGQLTLPQLAFQLDNGRPILAGVSFPGQPTLPGLSGHAVVFSGYDAAGQLPTITVRDPYPYERFIPIFSNPYIIAGGMYVGPGTYRIPLANLSGPAITWGNTVFDIK